MIDQRCFIPPFSHACSLEKYAEVRSCIWQLLSSHDNISFFQVKARTSNDETYITGSHVMKYGDDNISAENVYVYLGSDPANANSSWSHEDLLSSVNLHFSKGSKFQGVHQRDADLLFLWHKVCLLRITS